MIRVAIFSNHRIIREGIKNILEQTSDLKVTAEFDDRNNATNIINSGPVDVLILDFSLQAQCNIHIIKSFYSMQPKLPMLVLSRHDEEQYGYIFFLAGASGYMTVDCSPAELIRALHQLARGLNHFKPVTMAKLDERRTKHDAGNLHEQLSAREFQTLVLIGAGKTNRQSANELGINHKTVITYRQRLLLKMQMKTNAELMNYVIKKELSLW